MSRPKKYTTEIQVCLTPEFNALLGKRAAEEKRGKSDLVRLILERALLGAPEPQAAKSSPTMKPLPGKIAFTPRPREDDEERYPWRKFGFTEEEWDTIPEEDQDKLKRGEAQALPRRRKP